jgi:uncharacterized damage-inducible protein DinB
VRDIGNEWRNFMTENVLGRLFEHNNWANHRILEVCAALTDEQLDARPQSATKGTIRETLEHLVSAQQRYIDRLAGREQRFEWKSSPTLNDLQQVAKASGEELLALAKSAPGGMPQDALKTRDGTLVEPWVLMVQVINHATEHREQINSMLTALGLTPPDMDGWTYGEATGGLKQPSG